MLTIAFDNNADKCTAMPKTISKQEVTFWCLEGYKSEVVLTPEKQKFAHFTSGHPYEFNICPRTSVQIQGWY